MASLVHPKNPTGLFEPPTLFITYKLLSEFAHLPINCLSPQGSGFFNLMTLLYSVCF